MVVKNYYKILDLETSRVSINEIKAAYRQAAKKYHPDLNVGDALAEERIKDINEAYRTLSSEKLRRRYDFSWHRYVGRRKKQKTREKKSLKEILINIFFGNIPKKKKKEIISPKYGENIVTEIQVSLEEAFFGITKRLRLKNVKGKETTFNIKVPAGVQNGDKIRILGQGKTRKKWWKKWRFISIYTY